MTASPTDTRTRTGHQIGTSAPRPDGIPKVKGEFAFSSDLHDERMLWAHILRSPHPSARIRSIDISAALRMPGVHAVLTQADVPAQPTFGMEHQDQPVFAHDVVRYHGEAIAAIAADHPDLARRAAEAIVVEYEVLEPLIDAEAAITAAPIHPEGNVFRHLVIRHGDQGVQGEVQVEGTYEVGMQDQAFMGPESGMAVPDDDGLGVELHISTQWLHSDLWQVEACLGLEPGRVRLALAGVGGAFGAREDVSMHVHLCMLALRTRRPVKIVYSRLESFLGHVHRHPARMWYRHHADRDGRLVRVEARLVFDGGAYMSPPVQCWPTRRASRRARTSSRAPRSTRGRCGRTTRRAVPCAGSAPCRPATATSRRWTSSPRHSAWIPSSCAGATRSSRARRSSPARSSTAPRPSAS